MTSLFPSGSEGALDGRQEAMLKDLKSPAHQKDLAHQKLMKESIRHLAAALPRSLIAPPLAPSFEKLQNLVDDVSKDKIGDGQSNTTDSVDPKMLPCLLRGGGCQSSYEAPTKTKSNSGGEEKLQKTQASIERAVTKLQEDLDMRTAEVVKEIERRAAEMRREIAQEAEQLIEAVKYLVTLLSDSVTRADEMGQGFVREWFDEAEQRYVGMSEKESKPLDDDISQWDDDLNKRNKKAHSSMVEDLKSTVEKTRKKYGGPKEEDLTLDQQLGLATESPNEEELWDDNHTDTDKHNDITVPDSSVAPKDHPHTDTMSNETHTDSMPKDTHPQTNAPSSSEQKTQMAEEGSTDKDEEGDGDKGLSSNEKAYGFIDMIKSL